jgi:hypothetical protein
MCIVPKICTAVGKLTPGCVDEKQLRGIPKGFFCVIGLEEILADVRSGRHFTYLFVT